MKQKRIPGAVLLFITALIWGVAFVAQSEGADRVSPFTLTGIRNLIGALVLEIPLLVTGAKHDRAEWKRLLIGGAMCGFFLCAASSMQQFAIGFEDELGMRQPVSKISFLTSLYPVFVPVIGFFLKQKTNRLTWLCLGLAVIGLVLLTEVYRDFRLSVGDVLSIACSVLFAVHIINVDRCTAGVNCLRLAQLQFLSCSLISILCALLFENNSWADIRGAAGSLLYLGVLSTGVAFTLQMVGQKHCKPTLASLIMSLESVFGALAGFLLLGERLTWLQLLGCVLVLAAVMILQLKGSETQKA